MHENLTAATASRSDTMGQGQETKDCMRYCLNLGFTLHFTVFILAFASNEMMLETCILS